MQTTTSPSSSFLLTTLANTPPKKTLSPKKPPQTMVASGVLGLQKTPAKTQEGLVINQLLYKEESWQTLPLIKTGFLWGGLLGATLHPIIGLAGSVIKRQCIHTGQAWKQEGVKKKKAMLTNTGRFFVWLGVNTPYVDTHDLKSWGTTAFKGGFFGGLMGIGLAWGVVAQIKHGLQSIEADAQGNTNLLKTATWEHKVNNALNQTNQPLMERTPAKAETTQKNQIEAEEKAYQQWRKRTFSHSHTFNAMLASGLIYSLLTLGLNALVSKLVFNQLTKTNWPWHQWFKKLEQVVNHPVVVGEKHPSLKKLHPFINWLPGVKNGKFTLKSIINRTNIDSGRWLSAAFIRTIPTPAEPNPTQRLLYFLEKSQENFFFQLASARYHPVTLLQLFVTASVASALMTISNKRLVKRVEQTIQKEAPQLPSQLGALTAEDKRRVTRVKALKKSVSDAHFSQDIVALDAV
ncbi:MAG: hypothetical protein NTW61_00375 [Candidatus Melainabacteria bacterium]|jgi:hypothetical protein|nr:hypothetical protein [Candidatus Melainabacteria bacterium]